MCTKLSTILLKAHFGGQYERRKLSDSSSDPISWTFYSHRMSDHTVSLLFLLQLQREKNKSTLRIGLKINVRAKRDLLILLSPLSFSSTFPFFTLYRSGFDPFLITMTFFDHGSFLSILFPFIVLYNSYSL